MYINYVDQIRTSNVLRVRERASPETSTCEVPRDVSRKLQLTLCAIMCDNGVVEVSSLHV